MLFAAVPMTLPIDAEAPMPIATPMTLPMEARAPAPSGALREIALTIGEALFRTKLVPNPPTNSLLRTVAATMAVVSASGLSELQAAGEFGIFQPQVVERGFTVPENNMVELLQQRAEERPELARMLAAVSPLPEAEAAGAGAPAPDGAPAEPPSKRPKQARRKKGKPPQFTEFADDSDMDPAFKQGVQTVCEAMHRNRLISQPIGEAKVSHAKRRLEALIKTGFLLPDLPLPVGLSYVTRVQYAEAEAEVDAGAGAIAIAGAVTHPAEEEEEDDGFVVELADDFVIELAPAVRILLELMPPLPPMLEAIEFSGGSGSGPPGVLAGVPSSVLLSVMAATSVTYSLPMQQSVALPVTKADKTAAKAAKAAGGEKRPRARKECKHLQTSPQHPSPKVLSSSPSRPTKLPLLMGGELDTQSHLDGFEQGAIGEGRADMVLFKCSKDLSPTTDAFCLAHAMQKAEELLAEVHNVAGLVLWIYPVIPVTTQCNTATALVAGLPPLLTAPCLPHASLRGVHGTAIEELKPGYLNPYMWYAL
ncbi:hypothetical protein T492DRAFT_834212 [Pavlovales sp. CCMP2436]|nr:hypothetical protein T492DRAFT_834212 [Pavlovales sp. CCMP2436]